MADEALTRLVIDPGPALAALDRVRASVEGMEAEYRSLNKAGANIFDGAEKSTAEFIGEVDELTVTMAKAQAAMQNLTRYEKFLEQQQRRTTDPAQIRKYADEIARVRLAMSELRATGVDAWAKIEREQHKGLGVFGALKTQIASALPIISLTAVAAGAIKAAGAYEQTRASFETFLRSAQRADELLGDLNAASIATPFTTEQFERGAKSLLAVNVAAEKVVPTLEQIATISAATGKDFNELATIYAKARTAGVLYAEDINQLIDAGIPIIEEFAAILDTTPDRVKKLASEGKISFSVLEGAFQNLTQEGGRFSGLLEKQSQTLPGLFSTLEGSFQNLLRLLGGGGVGNFFKALIAGATGLTNTIVQALTPAQKSLADQTRETQAQFNAELEVIKQGNFTQEERARLIREVNSRYSEYLPNLISERATLQEIETAQRAANSAFLEKIALLDLEKQLQDLLEETNRRVEEGFQAQKRLNAEFANTVDQQSGAPVFNVQQVEQSALAEGLRNTRAEGLAAAAEYEKRRQEIIEGSKTLLDSLGVSFDNVIKRLNQGQQEAVRATGGVSEAAAKQAAEVARKQAELRLAVLQEGRDKEIRLEQARFEALNAELRKYFRGREELNGLLEDAEGQHRQRVLDINARFDAEELAQAQKAQADREALRISLIEDGTQRELAAERARFERVRADIERQFEGTAELPGLLEQARAQHLANLDRINSEGLVRILESEQQFAEDEIALFEAQGKQLVLLLQQRGASAEQVAEAQRQLDLAVQKKRLEAEIAFQQALLLATAEGDAARRAEIQRQIALLEQQLANLNIEIPKPKGEGIDLAELLGLTPDQINAVKSAAQQIVGFIQQITAARVQDAEEALRLSQDRVRQAEEDLDREIQLAEEGFASNVTLKRQELEEARQQEQAALQERQKAVRQQQNLEGALQAVNLLSASAKIFNSLAAAGPIGIGIAVAAIATMFAAFAKLRLDATRATKFREGGQGRVADSGVIVGPSHDSGGVPLEVEGGEFFATDGKRFAVVKKHLTERHFELLDAVNSDDRPRIAAIAAQLGAGQRVFLQPGVGAASAQRSAQATTTRQTAELVQLKEANKLLAQNNAYLKQMLNGKPETKHFQGGREERLPGLTKIIRAR